MVSDFTSVNVQNLFGGIYITGMFQFQNPCGKIESLFTTLPQAQIHLAIVYVLVSVNIVLFCKLLHLQEGIRPIII